MREMKYTEILQANRVLGKTLAQKPEYKVVVLSNIITSQFNDIFEYKLRSNQIKAIVSSGDYDNILQDSSKYALVNAIVVFWELANLIDGLQYKATAMNHEVVEALIEKTKSEIDLLFQTLSKTSIVIFNQFSSLAFNYSFLDENKFDYICKNLNRYLEENCPDNFFIINIDKILSRLSIEKCIDFRYYYSSKSLYTIEFYKTYAEFISSILLSTQGKNKKALIVDCDNTIWKGTVGEDGINDIELSSNDKSGNVFEEVQHLILALSKQGIIIGICSKNNLDDVNEIFEKRIDMTIKEKDILIKKINWENKVLNLQEIADELNIGLDSLVFIDDSKFEIDFVKEQLPEVTTLQVPDRAYAYPDYFRKNMSLFYKHRNTTEDFKRLELYKDEQRRKIERQKFRSVDEYLQSLSLGIEIGINDRPHIGRIAQLTQKTNQFNLTTNRYTEVDIQNFMKSEVFKVYTLRAKDKFGDYGLTGVAIIKGFDKLSVMDSFMMSCRILGRNIEIAFFNFIVNDLRLNGYQKLESHYIRTNKNSQVESFYESLGLLVSSNNGQIKTYNLDINNYNSKKINYITVENYLV
jgi:FkbH-like protein